MLSLQPLNKSIELAKNHITRLIIGLYGLVSHFHFNYMFIPPTQT